MTPTRRHLAAAALLGLAALTACSATTPASPTPATTPASSASAAPAAAGGDTSAACAALPPWDAAVVGYPGADPDAPPPTPDQLKQWAPGAVEAIGRLSDSAPVELDGPIATLRTAVDGAAKGTPVDPTDPAVTSAATAVDKWGFDNCRFPTIDVTGTGSDLTGVPATLPAGPVAVRFDNGGEPDKRGFVLLVAKVKDGARYTLDGIRNGSDDFNKVADVVGAAQPPEGESAGYAVATLTPGRYLLVSPVGVPPQFTGTVATEIQVG